MLTTIIAGVVTGSVYSLAAVGLVLTYKTSGIFNLAHGALSTVAAYLFYSLYVQLGVPWYVAALLVVFVLGPVLGLLLERMARALATASFAVRTLSTVGILLAVQGAALLIYGAVNDRAVPQFLPDTGFDLGGARVEFADVFVFVLALVATVALTAFFRFARAGVAMRAVVDNPELLDVAGTNPNAVRRAAWIIGVSFASASGVLLAPLLSALDPTTLTLLVVQAFGAAAIGAFTSIPRTYLGGLAIGVAAALVAGEFTSGLLAGLPAALPFLVLFVVLLVSSRSKLAVGSVLRPPTRSSWRAPWQIQAVLGTVLLVLLVSVPFFVSYRLTDWTLFLGAATLLLSLGLLVRESGQVSLCHVAFAAIGASAISHLAVDQGWPWLVALLAAGIVAVPIGALLAIPAIRLSGVYLALATFGFGILLSFMFYTQDFMFGSTGAGLIAPRPELSFFDVETDAGYYYVVLVVAVLVTAGLVALNRTRLGRLLAALTDSPTGLVSCGTSVNVTRVLVFCISAFLAAIAGALTAVAQQAISGAAYPPLLSLTYFALVIIAVGSSPWYAVLGAAGLTLVPSYFSSTDTANVLTLLFGVFAILFAVTPEDRRGVPLSVQRVVDRTFRRRPAAGPPVEAGRLAGGRADTRTRVQDGLLEVTGLKVRFGGLVAVDGVDVAVRTGHISGLIGPNGAGKTTTFNACCGLNGPSAGVVRLDGRDIGRLGAAARARLGIGRTFQQIELFDSLTVAENVAMGMEGSFAGLDPRRHVLSGPAARRRVRSAERAALELCGIEALAGHTTGSLSTGQRRLVELARCLAAPHRLLLLDEPSSGLDKAETERFGDILLQVVAERGVGILLVEHDMELVRRVCEDLLVLDFGKQIFAGDTREALSSPIVQSAYLGGNEVEDAVAEKSQAAS